MKKGSKRVLIGFKTKDGPKALQKTVTPFSFCAGIPVYLQDPIKYHADIRLNNPKVGVIIEGVFFAFGTLEVYNYKWQLISEQLPNKMDSAEAREIIQATKTAWKNGKIMVEGDK